MKLNQDLLSIKDENEFMMAAKIVREYKQNHKDKEILSLGIGDVSFPIIMPIIHAMHQAVEELGSKDTFHGYGDSSGYDFLKEAILAKEYHDFGFTKDEIYISNGTKTDVSSILELFDQKAKIGIPTPTYPIYRNGAYCLSRKVSFLPAKEKEGFIPKVPSRRYDLIYLCSPNNPVGVAYTYSQLQEWVQYALENHTVLLYDNAYYEFIQSKDVPKSIYAIDGAKKVAIEMRSFSKSISFTGVRCSYYVIPDSLCLGINTLWKKRTINRFNGADYIAQRGAAASFLPESQEQIQSNMAIYHQNTALLKDFYQKRGNMVYGGVDAPYIWVKIKSHASSWQVFEHYLKELNIVVTPGIIFGKEGDSFIRLSGLASSEMIQKAMERVTNNEET